MAFAAFVANRAHVVPHRPAVIAGETVISYAELIARAARLAGGLTARFALAPGDRVALFFENHRDFYTVLLACWHAGLTPVPVNAKLHARELHWIIENAAARLLITSPKGAAAIAEPTDVSWPPIVTLDTGEFDALAAAAPTTRHDVAITDDAWLFYTSGTTGRPKGARLSHRSLLFMCQAYLADIDPLAAGDTMLHAAPLTHGSGLYGLAALLRGGANLILPGFDPHEVFDAIARHRNVSFFAAPTMITRLLAHHARAPADTTNLKTITYGGAPMYVADLERALAAFGPKLYQLYGQGESPMTITGLDQSLHADADHPDHRARLASVGAARTGVEVMIAREDGSRAEPDEVGEIITRSDALMTGYLDNPEANARTIRDGWLWTGDLGAMDAAGFVTLKDRSKDMIISGGTNIYPREIEEVLLTHPDVAECAVVGRPHADWGEEVVAFIVPRPGHAPRAADLDALCLANIARFKRPKDYRFVTDLPKNNYGKVLKTELRTHA